MKTQAIISLLTSMAALASSTPLPSFDVSTLQLDKKATKSVYICTDSNFGGACQNLVSNSGECKNLGSPFQDSITSLDPPQGTTCNIYNNINCKTDQGYVNGVVNPGINNLGDAQYQLNDVVSSYVCY